MTTAWQCVSTLYKYGFVLDKKILIVPLLGDAMFLLSISASLYFAIKAFPGFYASIKYCTIDQLVKSCYRILIEDLIILTVPLAIIITNMVSLSYKRLLDVYEYIKQRKRAIYSLILVQVINTWLNITPSFLMNSFITERSFTILKSFCDAFTAVCLYYTAEIIYANKKRAKCRNNPGAIKYDCGPIWYIRFFVDLTSMFNCSIIAKYCSVYKAMAWLDNVLPIDLCGVSYFLLDILLSMCITDMVDNTLLKISESVLSKSISIHLYPAPYNKSNIEESNGK